MLVSCLVGLGQSSGPDTTPSLQEQVKLTAEDGAEVQLQGVGQNPDFFGTSVAADGDYVIVGAYRDDYGGVTDSGSAYIFMRDGDVWTQVVKLTAEDRAEEDFFGHSVAMDGDYVVVGAFGDDDAGSSSGSAYVFIRDQDTWTQIAKLTAPDAAAGDRFGISVDLDDGYIVIGADSDDDDGEMSGSAYIFEWTGNEWVFGEKLTAEDAAMDDAFGTSVAVSSARVVVGAALRDEIKTDVGAAYVFERGSEGWMQTTKLTAPDAAEAEHFGLSVAIQDDSAVVGAYNDTDSLKEDFSGSVYVFEHVGGWKHISKLKGDGAAQGAEDGFGTSVAVQNDRVLVGAPRDDSDALATGSVYVFRREGESWIRSEKLVAEDRVTLGFFGRSVTFARNHIVVGAVGFDKDRQEAGFIYLFSE